MPSFEDVTPTVLQSSVPQESRANMKNKVLEIISFLLLWVQLLFSQKLEAGASAHLAPHTHIHSWVWGESRMRRTFTLSVDWGVAQSGEKCKHASGSPSHMFILPHTHKQLVCIRSHSHIRSPKDKTEKCQLLNIGKAQQPQEWQTVEERLAQALSHAFSQKSKHAAFIPQQSYLLLNNSALSLCDKLEVSCIVYEYLRGWGYSDCEDYPSTLRNVSRPFLKMPFMLKAR